MFKKVKDELSRTAVLLEEIMNGGLAYILVRQSSDDIKTADHTSRLLLY